MPPLVSDNDISSSGGEASPAVLAPAPAVSGLNFFEDVSSSGGDVSGGNAAGAASALLVQARQVQAKKPSTSVSPPQQQVDWSTGLVEEPGSYRNPTGQLSEEEDDL
jgi:hypothetical protein